MNISVSVVTNDVTTLLLDFIHSEFPVLPQNGNLTQTQLNSLETFIKQHQRFITNKPVISAILWKFGWNGHHFYTDDDDSLHIKKLVDCLSSAHLKAYRFKERNSSMSMAMSPGMGGPLSPGDPGSPSVSMSLLDRDRSTYRAYKQADTSSFRYAFRAVNMYNPSLLNESEEEGNNASPVVANGIDGNRLDSLTIQSYCPDVLLDTFKNLHQPIATQFFGACILVDISGFTKLSNMFCGRGTSGLDDLHMATNEFLGFFADTIYEFDGDVIAFAGDALLCVFRNLEGDSQAPRADQATGTGSTRGIVDYSAANLRALHCAWLLRDHSNAQLSVHIAISCGEMSFAVLGGYKSKWTFILNGACIPELSACIDSAKSKEVVVTSALYSSVEPHMDEDGISVEMLEGGIVKILSFKANKLFVPTGERFADVEAAGSKDRTELAKVFVAAPVIDAINLGQYHTFMSEVREVTTMFIKLDSYNSLLHRNPISLQSFYFMVQKALYESGGFMRQFLIDDKGCVLIAMWGVPSFAYGNNCSRAVTCSRKIASGAKALSHQVSIGITTGDVFCGNVGSESRHDYVGIGHTVNLAARFMGKAHGSTLMDTASYEMLQAAEKTTVSEGDHLRLKGVEKLVPSYKVGPAAPVAKLEVNTKEATVREHLHLHRRPDNISEAIVTDIVLQLALIDTVDRQFVLTDVKGDVDKVTASLQTWPINRFAGAGAGGSVGGSAGSSARAGSPRPMQKKQNDEFMPKIMLGKHTEAKSNLRSMTVQAFYKQYSTKYDGCTCAVDMMKQYSNEDVFVNSGRDPQSGLCNVSCSILESAGGKAEITVPKFFLKHAWNNCTRCITITGRLVDGAEQYGLIRKMVIKLIGMENCMTESQQKHIFGRLLRTAYGHNESYEKTVFRDHMLLVNAFFGFQWKENFAPKKYYVDFEANKDYFLKSGQLKALLLHFVAVILAQKPSAIVFENCQFMDALSLQFLSRVLDLPVCLALLVQMRVPPPKVSGDMLLALKGNNQNFPASARKKSRNILQNSNDPIPSTPTSNNPAGVFQTGFALESFEPPPMVKGLSTSAIISRVSVAARSLFGINTSDPVAPERDKEMENSAAVPVFHPVIVARSSKELQKHPSGGSFALEKRLKSTVSINTLRKSALLKAYQEVLNHPSTRLLKVENMTKEEVLVFLKKGLQVGEIDEGIIDIVFELSNGNWYWCNNLLKFIQQRGKEEFFDQMSEEGAQKHTLALLTICGFDSLRPQEKILMKAAAVIGEEFHREMLEKVLPHSFRNQIDDLLESLVSSGLLMCVDYNPPCYSFPSGQITQILHDVMPRSEAMLFHEAIADNLLASTDRNTDTWYQSISYHLGFCPERRADAFKYDILAADQSFNRVGLRQEVLEFVQQGCIHATTYHEHGCALVLTEFCIYVLSRSLDAQNDANKHKQQERGGFGAIIAGLGGKSEKLSPASDSGGVSPSTGMDGPLGAVSVSGEPSLETTLAAFVEMKETLNSNIANLSNSSKGKHPRLQWRPKNILSAIAKVVAEHAAKQRRFSTGILSFVGMSDASLTMKILTGDFNAPFDPLTQPDALDGSAADEVDYDSESEDDA